MLQHLKPRLLALAGIQQPKLADARERRAEQATQEPPAPLDPAIERVIKNDLT